MSLDRLLEIYSLFGWFYLSIGIYALLLLIFSVKGKRFLRGVELIGVACILLWTIVYTYSTFSRETGRIQKNIQHVFAPFEEKMEYEHQFYSTYFVGFRPIVFERENRTTIRLIDVPVVEYLMARGYLYPAGVIESGLHSVEPGDLVIASRGVIKDQKWIVIASIHNLSFAIALPDPALYLLEEELELMDAESLELIESLEKQP